MGLFSGFTAVHPGTLVESHDIVAMDENGAIVLLPFFLRGVTSNLTVITLTHE